MDAGAAAEARFTLADLNASKLLFFSCALVFAVLLPLKLDGIVDVSFWIVFVPLWVLDAVVVIGCVVGVAHWCKKAGDTVDRRDVIGMVVCTIFFVLMLITEILVCIVTEGIAAVDWRVVLLPLYLAPILGLAASLYNRLMPRRFPNTDLEDFMTLGFMPWIFIAVKLAGIVDWTWRVTFTPVWLVYALLLIGMVTYVVRAIRAFRNPAQSLEQRMFWLVQAVHSAFLTIPTLAFMIVLAMQLDALVTLSWLIVFAPLVLTLAFEVWASAVKKGGNPHWFGRTVVEEHLRRILPRFGEVSYSSVVTTTVPARVLIDEDEAENDPEAGGEASEKESELKIPPYVSIETPD